MNNYDNYDIYDPTSINWISIPGEPMVITWDILKAFGYEEPKKRTIIHEEMEI